MKYLSILFTLILVISSPIHSNPSSTLKERQLTIISNLFDQLMQHQTNSPFAVEQSVNTLLQNYPEQIDIVLKVAIEKYPKEYKQIICGALKAEPALTSDIMTIFLQANIASIKNIVSIAVNEEPAYATEIVNITALHYPNELENIVRVAISIEPVMGKNIVNQTMQSYPDKLLNILVLGITALPDQVTNLVRNTLRLSPHDSQVISVAVRSSTREKTHGIIAAAIQSGMTEASAIEAAIAGGAEFTQIDQYNTN